MKKYIVPETVVIHVPSNSTLLSGSGSGSGEKQVDYGDGTGSHDTSEGGLDDGEEISAKPHSLWDSGTGDSSGSSWGNPWN